MNIKSKTTSEVKELLKWAYEKVGNRQTPPDWVWINTLRAELKTRSDED